MTPDGVKRSGDDANRGEQERGIQGSLEAVHTIQEVRLWL
jgi:hypothetical protein